MKLIIVIFILLGYAVHINAQVSEKINIGEKTITFNDSLRKRPLKTEIWYPTKDVLTNLNNATADFPFVLQPTVRNASLTNKKCPLILLSHGTGGSRLALAWLAYNLVQKGFIVAAVDHWGNTYDNKIPEQFVKPWERPQDISFVLTQLLNDTLYRKNIDANKIGAAGFSLGGYTVIALAGGQMDLQSLNKFAKTKEGKQEMTIPEYGDLSKLFAKPEIETSYKNCPDLKDNRIKAFFAIAPAIGQSFETEKQFGKITNPVYIVGIENDKIAPVIYNALQYHNLIKNSEYYLVSGNASHYVMLNVAKDELKKEAKIYYQDVSGVDRQAIHELISAKAIEFFQKSLK